MVLAAGYLTQSLRVIDLVLIAFLAWGAYKGYKRGLIRELIATLVFVFSVIFVFKLIQEGFNLMRSYMEGGVHKVVPFLTYIIAFMFIAGMINFLGRKLKNAINYTLLDEFDQFGGLIIGLFKYMCFLSILVGILNFVGFVFDEENTKDTVVYPMLLTFFDWLIYAANVVAPFTKRLVEEMKDILRGDESLNMIMLWYF